MCVIYNDELMIICSNELKVLSVVGPCVVIGLRSF